MANQTILVSACLLGLNTRYNGVSKRNQAVVDYLTEHQLTPIPVCPEQLGGLPTPRPPTDFCSGDGNQVLDGRTVLINRAGEKVDQQFIRGAEQTLLLSRHCGCRKAILKERSPSCGCHLVYRQGEIVPGQGVTTALLLRHGFTVQSEEEINNKGKPIAELNR